MAHLVFYMLIKAKQNIYVLIIQVKVFNSDLVIGRGFSNLNFLSSRYNTGVVFLIVF